MNLINFFSEETSFKLKNQKKTSAWINCVADKENKSVESLNFIFCTDRYLLQINLKYLSHSTLTDIITFDQSSDTSEGLEGDIFISIDRVKENSKNLQIPFYEELRRVIIHGVLHLIGYTDKNPHSKALMRKKEDAYLSLRKRSFT